MCTKCDKRSGDFSAFCWDSPRGNRVLKGTHLSAEFVLDLLAAGWDYPALQANYPNLTEERIRAVLAYTADTFREERFYLLPPTGTHT